MVYVNTRRSWKPHPYEGREIVLTSKHKKIKQISPAFNEIVGCYLSEVALDTDQLGTFSGEIERKNPPRETAILKARLGMDAASLPLGLASEGSVGADPFIPFVNSNIEHLVLVDDERNIVISEVYRSFDITVATETTAPGRDISHFLRRADFPRHGLIVRPNSEKKSHCLKGISDLKELSRAIQITSQQSPDGLVIIESDLRAHLSPSRQRNIAEVAKLLAHRVSHLCNECQTPGWGKVGYEKGLQCSECGLENPDAPRQEIFGCVKCDYTELDRVIATSLDPARCNFCNP